MQSSRFLMCPPDYYSVEYVINPWMEGNIHRASPELAGDQWRALCAILKARSDIEIIQAERGLPDMVFTANAGFVMGQTVILSRFFHKERQVEYPHYRRWFQEHGFQVRELPVNLPFEGAGDALPDRARPWIWGGYGFRSELDSHLYVARWLDVEVVSLRLVDPRFYHLDTCLCPLEGGYLIYYPAAFDAYSNRLIERRVPAARRIVISTADATEFACNAINIEKTIILNQASPDLRSKLEAEGFSLVETPFTEFMKAGGSARCLTLRLDEPVLAAPQDLISPDSRIVRLEGHLLDSGLLNRALDRITQSGGSFQVLSFDLGEQKQNTSVAEIKVIAPSDAAMEPILHQLIELGAVIPHEEVEDARRARVAQAGVAPDDFYVSTIYPTEVLVNGEWIRVEGQRMDAAIVVSPVASIRNESGPLTPNSGGTSGPLILGSGGTSGALTPNAEGTSGPLTPHSGGKSGPLTPDSGGKSGPLTPNAGGASGPLTPHSGGTSGPLTLDSGGTSGPLTPKSGEPHAAGRGGPDEEGLSPVASITEPVADRFSARCKLLRDLLVGEEVVVGALGIRKIRDPESREAAASSEVEEFGFMGAGVSSERRVEIVVGQLAWEMRRFRDQVGKVVVVAGPVVIHTGGGEHLAWLVREGYVQALLGGNAIAVHDIEQALLGTSLGVDVRQGVPVHGGHRHHLRAINSIRRCGGIKAAVEQGVLTHGVFYECVRAGVPFSLAGSIRDDGPLPDTQMDLIQAQADYARLIEGADLILMLSSMLHSIGTGNMTPAGVKLVCVDINPAVVTKLSDRGSLESRGVVTDVGLFLKLLVQELQALEKPG